jgi:gamma-glutamyltranspeptidase/glutathione hydrolase
VLATLILSIAGTAAGAPVVAPGPSLAPQEQGRKVTAHAANAMVSTAHPLVARAMLDVLKKGGNALDAALVGQIMQTVIEPQMTTLAGAMSLLYYDAKSKRYYYLDAELNHTRQAPTLKPGWVQLTLDPPGIEDTSGALIAVPGTVAGLKAAADRFGTMKWADYFKPAIDLADNGFAMYSFLYGETADAALGHLSAYPEARAEFMPNGFVPPVGSLVRRPLLAATMRRLASEGPAYFYTGDWAKKFVAAAQRAGGSLTLEDMASYQVRWEEPLHSTYRGFDIIGSPPPATAGTLVAMILNILEPWDLKAQPHYSQSADSFYRIRRAFAFAEDLTDAFIQDPISFNVPTETLLSKDFARMLTALIDGSEPKAAPTAALLPEHGVQVAARFDEKDPHSSDTNQIVAVDREGNMVSMTHSVDGSTFGPGVVVDGVVANGGNNFPGWNIGEGRRTVDPFPPMMVAKDGKPVLTIGSPGLASRAVALTLINYLGYGMSLEDAIDAPRFQGAQTSRPATIESRVSEQTRGELKSRYGVVVRTTMPYNWHFGSVHAIARERDGTLTGVADPRRDGEALGY